MASDGRIDKKEIALIKTMCRKSILFKDYKIEDEINLMVVNINEIGKGFISNYFDLLKVSNLTEQEELQLIDFAIQTIQADDQIEYSEIKFFKNIRHRLNLSDSKILEVFPDIEKFIEEDIITDSFLDKIALQYLETAELPQFDFID
jgi:uncharacterized tellurite resistance protein B-like protein